MVSAGLLRALVRRAPKNAQGTRPEHQALRGARASWRVLLDSRQLPVAMTTVRTSARSYRAGSTAWRERAVHVKLRSPVTSTPPRSLELPLPGGMRDLLPEETRSRRALAKRVLERFALAGYAIVTPPAFEFADVLERGLGTLDPAEVLRFVEPESGEVAALRPDVTPQIARMIATRLHDRPPPYRLCYEGTVLRRRSTRARGSTGRSPRPGSSSPASPGPTATSSSSRSPRRR